MKYGRGRIIYLTHRTMYARSLLRRNHRHREATIDKVIGIAGMLVSSAFLIYLLAR